VACGPTRKRKSPASGGGAFIEHVAKLRLPAMHQWGAYLVALDGAAVRVQI
jgi:hypothetical protein